MQSPSITQKRSSAQPTVSFRSLADTVSSSGDQQHTVTAMTSKHSYIYRSAGREPLVSDVIDRSALYPGRTAINDTTSSTVSKLDNAVSRSPADLLLNSTVSSQPFSDPFAHFNWNNEFQSLYDQPMFTPHQIEVANQQKQQLVNAFLRWSSDVAGRLVRQLSQPRDEWEIQPLPQQIGAAGGEKFIVGQLFCKFARDDKGIYGSDELAIKMAKSEIRNVNAVLQLGVHSLHSSLMACHRINGHAVIVSALMPISSDSAVASDQRKQQNEVVSPSGIAEHSLMSVEEQTPRSSLVYGSADAGYSLHNSDEHMRDLIDRVAAQLGLSAHVVQGHVADLTVSIGADCEGHVSAIDGRYYLLDLGRLLPANDTRHPYTLVRQFRSEYLRWRVQNHLPNLSSDAFTNFGVGSDDAPVVAAITHYFDDYLPMIVQRVLLSASSYDWRSTSSGVTVTGVLHEHGINLRHLARVYNLVAAAQTDMAVALRLILLREMVLRAVKSMFLHRLRSNTSREQSLKPASSDEVLTALHLKYAELTLTDFDQQYVVQLTAEPQHSAASTTAPVDSLFWNEAQQLVLDTASDVVMAPDFPSVEQAEQRLLDELKLRERTMGPQSPALLGTMNNLLDLYKVWHADSPAATQEKADELITRMIAIANADDTRYSYVFNNCGIFFSATGQFDKALVMHERSLRLDQTALGERHPTVLTGLSNLASLYKQQGRFDRAQPLYERALKLREDVLGADHPHVAHSLNALGVFFYEQRQYDKALPLYERALMLRERILGEQHPDVADSLNNLATLYSDQGHYDQAERLYTRALQIREAVLGSHHRDVADSLDSLAVLYTLQERSQQALPMFLRALRIREETLGPDHPDVAYSCNNLGALYFNQGQFSQAEIVLSRALRIRQRTLPADHPLVALSRQRLQLVMHNSRS